MRTLIRCLAALVPVLLLWAATAHAQTIEGVFMPGKVIEGHAKLEGDCRNCHVLLEKSAQDHLCLDCHKDVAKDVTGKRGHHGRIRIDTCRGCHTEHKGRGARIAPLDETRFDHALTDYALEGKHDAVKCRACHRTGAKYRAAPGECNDCHRKDDKHKGTLGKACADCHGERGWKETTFDHAKSRFPLTGKHVTTKCNACHATPVYRHTPMTCIGCHKAADRHKGRYGSKCETCHGTRSWKETAFEHDTATHFALRGKHKQVKCDACHTGVLYRDKLKSQCIACHRKDDRHKGSLGTACGDCHVERDWKETRFDHDKTRFPLLGKHVPLECKACHKNNNFKDAPMTCLACHRKDDVHKNSLGEDCGKCHVERSWKETRFDHEKTRFALAGKHANVKCADCHTRPDPKATPMACGSCHQKDDKHKGTLGEKCGDCHVESTWKDTRFDHQKTRFPLAGRHTDVKCADCHTTVDPKTTPKACIGCHRKDDKHKGVLGDKCDRCHGESTWKEPRFDHAKTRFPLVGKHVPVACTACHANDVYKDTPLACVACHRKDDKHKGTLGEKCGDCHGESTWKETRFDHEKTRFPLAGKHTDVKCADCHTTVDPKTTPTACIGCHRKDDKHKGTLGEKCAQCHVEGTWKETRFDHGTTRYPLLGKHAAVKCADCHTTVDPRTTPRDCHSCHGKDDKHKGTLGPACGECHVERAWTETRFDHGVTRFALGGKHAKVKCADCHTTVDPKTTPMACVSCHRKDDKHKGTQSAQCERCHTDQSWKGARFDHERDARYVLRGKHKTATCESCHVKPAQGALPAKLGADCNGCHAREDVHKGQQGRNCEQCHRETDWKTTTFDHARSRFPLTGGHVKLACKTCHATQQYRDARRECVACHVKQDVHKRKLGTQCETCHNARSWKTWDFNHDKRTHFPLDGAHRKVSCYGCHTKPVEGRATLPMDCVPCHATDDVHDGRYGRQCERCHFTSNFKTIRQRQ